VTLPFATPAIYLITKGEATAENFPEKKNDILEIITAACRSGIALVQIREKRLTAKHLYELASEAVSITAGSNTRLLINDRADIAAACGADGVHLRSDSISAKVVRGAFPGLLIGVSVHSYEKAAQAQADGADFVTLAPVFSTPGKAEPIGFEELVRIEGKLKPFPVIALGGIDATNYEKVLASGGGGFAAIRFLNDQRNLKKMARAGAP
jgi:thiamine-phosphate pyrophosphorylase